MMEMAEGDEMKLVHKEASPAAFGGDGWSWGAWKSSAFSVLNEIQQVAADAAEEIQRNAAATKELAARGIADLQHTVADAVQAVNDEDVDALNEEEFRDTDRQPGSEEDAQRRAALLKLENASEDSFLGQGLKALNDSVDNLTTGAWQALGNVWKESVNLVHKLENTTLNQGGVLPPNLLQVGMGFSW